MEMKKGKPINRLRLLIVRIGDDGPAKVVSNLNKLLTVVCSKEHMYKEIIVDLLCTSISCLPDKAAIYASFLALLNIHTHTLVEDTFQELIKKFYSGIEKCDFLETKNLLKFLIFSVKTNLLKKQNLVDILKYMLMAYKQCPNKEICLVPLIYSFPFIMIGLDASLEEYNIIKNMAIECMEIYKSVHKQNSLWDYWKNVSTNDNTALLEALYINPIKDFTELHEPAKAPIELIIKSMDTPEALMSYPMTFTLPEIINIGTPSTDLIVVELIIDLFVYYKGAYQPLSMKLGALANLGYGQHIIKILMSLMLYADTKELPLYYAQTLRKMQLSQDNEQLLKASLDSFVPLLTFILQKLDTLEIRHIDNLSKFIATYALACAEFPWSLITPESESKKLLLKNISSILLRISYPEKIRAIKCAPLLSFLPEDDEDYLEGNFKYSEQNAEINGFPEAQLILDRMKERTNVEELKKLVETNLSQRISTHKTIK